MIFFSQLLNLPIVDSRQETIGRLKDVVVKVKEAGGYPEVFAIVFRRKGRQLVIPYQYIENLGYGEITLKKSDCWTEEYEFTNKEILLARDLIDQQIFDVAGIRVVRVNDLELVKIEEKFSLVGIDISNRALLRRLGLAALPIFRVATSHIIDWNNVSLVKGPVGNLQLKTSKEKLEKLHPADIANMIENLNFQESSKLVQSLDEETAAEVLEEVEPGYKDTLLERMSSKNLAQIVEEMPTNEAADIIQALSPHKKLQLYRRLGVQKAKVLHKLSKYGADEAGGMMSGEFMTLRGDMSVEQATRQIQKNSQQFGSIYHVYIVDGQKRLEGVVSIRTLLLAKHREKIADIMSKVYRTVRTHTGVDEVARVMTKYNLMSIAVLDRKKVMRGIITVDDILRYLVPNA
jgi:magnesium transporter